MRSTEPRAGVELLEAWFQGQPYQPHRHDTYAICLTRSGVQAFNYRGAAQISLPGQVVVLHPDELHDGHAGAEEGFGYQQLYVEPAVIAEVALVLRGRVGALPFARTPVVVSPALAGAIRGAFLTPWEPLAGDGLLVQLTAGLLAVDASGGHVSLPRHLDLGVLEQARQFLDAAKTRVVAAAELEAVTGLSRYELARQFRLRYGTSPYRYLLMRRLALARQLIAGAQPLAEVALEVGFADQAHLTRMFRATFGLTPAQYRDFKAAPAAQARG